jgi:hypothetical protein
MTKLIVSAAFVFGAAVLPVRAFASERSTPGQLTKLTDAQLDGVTGGIGPPAFVLAAGHGPPWMRTQAAQAAQGMIGTQVNFTIKDVTFTLNVGSNSSVNLAAALQLAVMSQQPQAASATAVQTGGH